MKYISLFLFILLLCGCKQQELLNHLDQQQANDVLAVLQRHNINAEKKDQGKTGFSIYVEPTDFASAVDWLKIYNLPGKPDIQISQMFPADALVSSPRAEKARLYSAIEQRLEQSLKIMALFLQEYMLVTMLIQVIVAKLLYQFIFLYLLYMKKISIQK